MTIWLKNVAIESHLPKEKGFFCPLPSVYCEITTITVITVELAVVFIGTGQRLLEDTI